MRVLAPVWAINWIGRYEPQFKALSEHVDDIQLVTYWHDLKLPESLEGICRLHYVDGPKRDPAEWRDLYNLAVQVLTEVDDFDVILTRTRTSGQQILDVLLSKLAKKPIVMRAVGNAYEARSRFMDNPLEKQFADALAGVALNGYDLIVPVSSTLGEHLKTRVLNPSRVTEPVPISINIDDYTPLAYPDELVIGYAGRISPEKGMGFLHHLMLSMPDTKFEMAGHIMLDGWEFPDNCHYMGELAYSQMLNFYRKASVVVLPSFTEGLPNVLLEAYASGRPVIVTPEAHPPELKVFGWELPHDVEKWKTLIESLTLDEIKALGKKARDYIRDEWPTWEDFGKGIADRLETAVDRHRTRTKQLF